MKVREKINLFIDLLLTLALALIAGIGFLIKYILPPGRERILKYGENKDLFFLGLDRHQWGSIHLVVAFVMLGLLVLHILLHWKTILCLVRKAIPRAWLRRSLWVIVGFLCLIFTLFAFFISPVQKGAEDFLHRHAHSASVKPGINQNLRATEPEKELASEATKTDHDQEHLHTGENHSSLNGRMTLADIAIQFRIPLDKVKQRLGLPAHVDSLETLGRLRKTYGFTMQQARERLEKANEL
jgi:hypothetical protein